MLCRPLMCPEPRGPRHQRGSALVVAIFALVVMAAIGAALIKLLESQQTRVVSEVLSLRALLLARAGAERQLVDLFPLNAPARHCDGTVDDDSLADESQFSGAFTLELSAQAGAGSCQPVAINCSSVRVGGVAVMRVSSEARCVLSGADGLSVSRRIEVEARAP